MTEIKWKRFRFVACSSLCKSSRFEVLFGMRGDLALAFVCAASLANVAFRFTGPTSVPKNTSEFLLDLNFHNDAKRHAIQNAIANRLSTLLDAAPRHSTNDSPESPYYKSVSIARFLFDEVTCWNARPIVFMQDLYATVQFPPCAPSRC